MRKIFFAFAAAFACTVAIAQQDTTWYDANWNITTKKLASFYRPQPILTDSGYLVKDYYLSGRLQYVGLREDAALEVYIGTSVWYNASGQVVGTRKFSELIKDGEQKEYHSPNQLAWVIPYKNWKRNGLATYYYRSGDKGSEVMWVDNKRQGKAVAYHQNGSIRIEANYTNDLSDGDYISYHENGKMALKRTFAMGKPTGNIYTFNERGDTITSMVYREGKLNGKFYLRDKSGSLKDGRLEGDFVDDIENANAIFKNGKIVSYESRSRGIVADKVTEVNDSISFFRHYNHRTRKLENEGYLKYDQPFGLWTFYTAGGVKKETYDIQSPVTVNYLYVDDENLSINFPKFLSLFFSLNESNIGRPVMAAYESYDAGGKINAQGNLINNRAAGRWKYTKPNGAQLTLDLSAGKINKQESLRFIEISLVKTEEENYYNQRIVEPWKIYIDPANEFNTVRDIGLMVEQLYMKDASFKKDVLNLMKQKLGKNYLPRMEEDLANNIGLSNAEVRVGELPTSDGLMGYLPVLLAK